MLLSINTFVKWMNNELDFQIFLCKTLKGINYFPLISQ